MAPEPIADSYKGPHRDEIDAAGAKAPRPEVSVEIPYAISARPMPEILPTTIIVQLEYSKKTNWTWIGFCLGVGFLLAGSFIATIDALVFWLFYSGRVQWTFAGMHLN